MLKVITVGDRIITWTNCKYKRPVLSEKLASIGINVYYHTVVGDNNKRLQQAIEVAKSVRTCLFLRSGLGPTKDDLTKETIASSLGESLYMTKCISINKRLF